MCKVFLHETCQRGPQIVSPYKLLAFPHKQRRTAAVQFVPGYKHLAKWQVIQISHVDVVRRLVRRNVTARHGHHAEQVDAQNVPSVRRKILERWSASRLPSRNDRRVIRRFDSEQLETRFQRLMTGP